MVKYILARASGSSKEDEIIKDRNPSKIFIIGTLASRKEEDIFGEVDDNRSSIRAQRMKVSFLCKNNLNINSSIKITATGNVYYGIDALDNEINKQDDNNEEDEDTDNEIKSKQRYRCVKAWKRVPFMYEWDINIYNNKLFTIDINFSNARLIANQDPNISKLAGQIPEEVWKAGLAVQINEFNDQCSMISIGFDNQSVTPKKELKKCDPFERNLFNCQLNVELNDIGVEEFVDEYMYEGHLQKYFYEFRTVNCQATWEEKGKVFNTKHYGEFIQDNVRPRASIDGIDVKFTTLMQSSPAIASLEALLNHMYLKLDQYKEHIPDKVNNEDFQPRYGNHQCTWGERRSFVIHFEDLIQHIEKGVNLVKNDFKVKESFLKTNETFNNYYNSIGIKNASWRIFQLVFLLAEIESVTQESDLDVVDVLHVDTGGGKSEAYFALTVFTIFYERLSGKKEGVSAIVKFPLRMLSIQQLERITSIAAHAEEVRKKYEICISGEPFSLGYYVGNSEEFPDLYSKNKKLLFKNGQAADSLILSKCPICSKRSVKIYDDQEHMRILHRCSECGKNFYIYTSDREIFRWRPTIIVSTVDKWAGLSQQRRIRSLLGGKGSSCPAGHGFIPAGDKCEDNSKEEFKCINIGNNKNDVSGPRLSIQDEMHLLREGFGTISSHFEGLIESMVEETSNHKLKHIAMSATLNGTPGQITQLYMKKTFIIPGRCPDGYGSENDIFFEKQPGPKRIIYGLKPNIRDNHYAALVTLLYYSEFIIEAQRLLINNPKKFCEEYNLKTSSEAQELIKLYLVPLTYHIKKQDAYDMYRLKQVVVADELKRKCNADIGGKVITGDSSLEELKEVINQVRAYINDYELDRSRDNFLIDPVFATSVVSHGVDLEELNFMVFQGLPYSTSEYIQALSRVGRKYLGIVLVWFYPNRVRDDSFYRNFSRYHDTIDHQVKPVPINRFSRLGLQQTINAMFCAGIINYLSDKKGRPIYLKQDFKTITDPDLRDLIIFIKKVYGRTIIDMDVNKEVEDRINQIRNSRDSDKEFFPNILLNSGEYFFRNPSGMRGIQKQLALGLLMSDAKRIESMSSKTRGESYE